MRTHHPSHTAAVVLAIALATILLLFAERSHAGDETCYPIAASQWAPAGVQGCTLDGPTSGKVSWYSGTSAAANWCLWPWRNCGAFQVTSTTTGLSIVIEPHMYCHCYWQTDRRLLDLTQTQVVALGLDLSQGIYPVVVTPLNGAVAPPPPPPVIPDTSMATPDAKGE